MATLTSPENTPPAELHNAPVLFAVLVLPYGFMNGVTTLLMPYLLRKNGVAVDEIATIVAIALLPSVWSFLWSPLADAGFRRRSWVIASVTGGCLAAAGAIPNVKGSHLVLTALLFLMNAFGGLLSSTCGALLTAMPVSLRGRSAGWYQGGNLAAGCLGGGLFIWIGDRASLPALAVSVAAVMVLPSLASVVIEEMAPVSRGIGRRFAELLRDLRDMFRARRTWVGLVFFLSPVGSSAMGNLASGLGPDYHVGGNEVLWVTGVGWGLLAALGCLMGGIVADRMNRMVAYALSGGFSAAFSLYLRFADPTPFAYAVGLSGYAIAQGFASAVYTAFLLDVLGNRRHAAASGYACLNAAGNVPVTYMTWLDGVGYKRWGRPGLMATDAAANAIVGIFLLAVAMYVGSRWRHWERRAAAEA